MVSNPEAAPAADVLSARSDRHRTLPRALVADDDPGTRLLLNESLSNNGFSVVAVSSGAEAIEEFRRFSPDLVLLDINMPGVDGITACKEMRKLDKRQLPIIMVTSAGDTLSIQHAFDCGATDFIIKPVNWPIFERRIATIVESFDRSRELDERGKRLRLLEKAAPEHVLVVSKSGDILENLNPGPELSGRGVPATVADIVGTELAGRFLQLISGVLKSRRHKQFEFELFKDGFSQTCEAQFLVEGRDRVTVIIQQIDARNAAHQEMFDLAYRDADTQLPNRRLFNRRASEAVTEAGLQGRALDIISVAFDGVAESYLDDAAIKSAIAARLDRALARCEGALTLDEGETVRRIAVLDKNWYACIAEDAYCGTEITAICDEISKAFADRIAVRDELVLVSPRFGIAAFPADGEAVTDLVDASGAAMVEAIEKGVPIRRSSRAAEFRSLRALDAAAELRQAINEGQLELYFQPQVQVALGAVTSIEALLRWNHPMRGKVGLIDMLELAQATGLMVPLGDWVLKEACGEARKWHGESPPKVAINLSRQELAQQNLPDRILSALAHANIEPSRVELEITEAALLRHPDAIACLRNLAAIGVGLVLDDFGTGHTSLRILKDCPLAALKIDRSFVSQLPDAGSAAICEIVITIAHKFGMRAVAEGVESEEQFLTLRDLGCDEYQGYRLCSPMPTDELRVFLDERQAAGR